MERPRDAIVWWESRRIGFNLVVLFAGIFTWLVVNLTGAALARLGVYVNEPMGIFPAAVFYALAVNVCYTLGWVSELLWSDGDTSRTEALRPAVYRWGITFSVAITLLPAVLVPMLWLLQGLRSVL